MKGIIRHRPEHHWDISKPIDKLYGIMFDMDEILWVPQDVGPKQDWKSWHIGPYVKTNGLPIDEEMPNVNKIKIVWSAEKGDSFSCQWQRRRTCTLFSSNFQNMEKDSEDLNIFTLAAAEQPSPTLWFYKFRDLDYHLYYRRHIILVVNEDIFVKVVTSFDEAILDL